VTQVRIGLAQARQTDSLEENIRTIDRFVDDAAQAGVQVLCFPECQTVGYRIDITPTDRVVPVADLENLYSNLTSRCRELGMALILGTETPLPSDPTKGKPYNSALVISERGEVLGVHHKTRLTPLDAVAYTAGTDIETFVLFGVPVGVVICFEGFRFAQTTEECVRQGAQLVFHPQNNTTRPNDWKIPVHHAMITTRAAENTIWFASCNACLDPYQNSASLIVAPNGTIHAESTLKREELVVADIETDLATRAMFLDDMQGEAELLFGDTVDPSEFASAVRPLR
jgi:ribosomal-protein-alanine N-acetyltransferase